MWERMCSVVKERDDWFMALLHSHEEIRYIMESAILSEGTAEAAPEAVAIATDNG
jgi:hypothetical protein